MRLVYVSLVVLLCFLIEIQSEGTRSGLCNRCQPPEGYSRIKRAKYYSGPPQRIYRRPPSTYPVRGAFSYTPPPWYMINDEEQPQPSYRPKVSKRPPYERAGEEDVNNIVKYLSKLDLNKAIEFSNEKERESEKDNKEFETSNYIISIPGDKKYESDITHKDAALEIDDQKFSLNAYNIKPQEDFRPYNIDYNNSNKNDYQEIRPSEFTNVEPTALFINENKLQLNTQLGPKESMQSHQFSYPNTQIHQTLKESFNTSDTNIFTDSSVMQEEQLPKPSNLREPDYDVSYTNNVPRIVRADSDSYKVENFGTLPLMNYHSKLDTVDSYRVPHYTVTSPLKYGVSPSSANFNSPPVEAAPEGSVSRDQSDAHLKAIKIWTHKSKGTAYTLHDDGSLSLERPSRSKPYGYS